MNGRHRRESILNESSSDIWHQLLKRSPLKPKRIRRHHHGEELKLIINMKQTKHRIRIVKLQPSVKVLLLFKIKKLHFFTTIFFLEKHYI